MNSMLNYLAKRIAALIPTLLLLLTLTFFLVRLAPGGPFDSDHAWPPEIQANLEQKYGLDQPVVVQFWRYVVDLAHGDFRESFQYIGRPVSEILIEALWPSFLLGSLALGLAIGFGVPLGAAAAWKRGSAWDLSAMFFSVAGVSLPSYLVASLLILVFSLWLGWLPPALWEGPSSLVLPVITLAVRPGAILARLTRTTLAETLVADYVRTASAKGLEPRMVIYKHALSNALIPILTILGPLAANLVTGSFLVEVVFQVPGLGRHFVQAVLNRDYPLVMGVTLVYGVILLGSNAMVDLLCAWADPRIQLGKKAAHL